MAGGLTKGKSHAKGGIKMKVKSTGQNIEVEGGEGIINKHTMSSKDKHTYEGKEMTACEIASDLNQKTGNGVSFDCDETDNTDMTPTDPSTGFAKGGKPKRKYKKKKMAKSKKKTGAYAKLVSKIMKRDGIPYREAQKKAKDEYVSGATSQKKKPKKTYKGRVDNLKSKSATKISYSGRPKKAKGGITKGQTLAENFNMKDEVQNVEFWKNDVFVKDKNGKAKRIDLDKGERISLNAKGGNIQNSPYKLAEEEIELIDKFDRVGFDNKVFTHYLTESKNADKETYYNHKVYNPFKDKTEYLGQFRDRGEAIDSFYSYKPKSFAKGGEIYGDEKVFAVNTSPIGKAKYSIKLYDGDSYKDGSPFIGIRIFSNKKDLATASRKFRADGYNEVKDISQYLKIKYYGKQSSYHAQGGELMDADTQVDYAKGGEVNVWKIQSWHKYDIKPKWGDKHYEYKEGERKFLSYSDAQKEAKKFNNNSTSFKYKVVRDYSKDEYAKGGDVSGKPVVESIDKIVSHYNGEEFDLDNYPPKSGSEWMPNAMELSLEEAKQFAKELDYELEYSEDVEDAENLQDLQYAILEDTEEKANHDNTYNASWWGGVVDFFVLERKEDDGYGEALVILRMHRGGDPRGNYYGYQAFKLNSFIEDFPAYFARLTYQINTNQGTITLDTEDMEGYTLLVVEDETGTFEVDDNVSIDDVDDKLDMNGVSIYAKGGQTKKFNNGGNIMDKKLELAASLSSQLEDIDFQYLDWDEINSFDELEEAVDKNGFFQQEVIYYGTAMDYLRQEDPSLREALELAGDMGYAAGSLSSEILASILKSERVRESFYELRTEIDDFFDELED